VGSKDEKKKSLYTLSRERLDSDGDRESYFKELEGQSDRACALIASAFAEHALIDLIKTKFPQLSETEENELFYERYSTLGTFASRIDIAYALAVVTKRDRSDLNIIRRIRNTFAHAVKNITFSDYLLRKEVKALSNFYEDSQVELPERHDLHKAVYILSCHRLSAIFQERRKN
jgi:hypothetical protein